MSRPAAPASRGESRRPRAPASALLAPVAALLLASCVDLEATLAIAPDGSGGLELRYAVSRMLAPLASLESDPAMLPFPLSRDAFEQAARSIGGIALDSYEYSEDAYEARVTASLSFDGLPKLLDFLDPEGERAVYSEEAGRRSLRIELYPGGLASDPDAARLAEAAFAGYRVALAVELPSPPLAPGSAPATGSATTAGSTARYENSVDALVASADPVYWEIVW